MSWCPWVCISLWVSVLLCLLVLQGVADYSTSHYCIPSRRSTTHPFVCCRYYCIAYQTVYMIHNPDILWHLHIVGTRRYPGPCHPVSYTTTSLCVDDYGLRTCIHPHILTVVHTLTVCSLYEYSALHSCIAGTAVQHTGKWSRGWWILHTLGSCVPS